MSCTLHRIFIHLALVNLFLRLIRGTRVTLRWRHNGRDSVSNHQPHDCLLNRLFRRRSKKTSKLRDTGLCAGISPGTGEFPAQMASNAENISIWWRHHDFFFPVVKFWYRCVLFLLKYMKTPCVKTFLLFTILAIYNFHSICGCHSFFDTDKFHKGIANMTKKCCMHDTHEHYKDQLEPILLTWINSYPSMDKYLHQLQNMEWNYPHINKLQWCNRLSLGK